MLLPQDSLVCLEIKDFDVKYNTDFLVTENGFLKPVIYAMELNWGETRYYHENWFLAMVFDQTT